MELREITGSILWVPVIRVRSAGFRFPCQDFSELTIGSLLGFGGVLSRHGLGRRNMRVSENQA